MSPWHDGEVAPDWAFIGAPFFNFNHSMRGFPRRLQKTLGDIEYAEDQDDSGNNGIVTRAIDAEMIVPSFGYGMSYSFNESEIVEVQDGLDLPWQCHDACFTHTGCNAWTYEYISYLSNVKLPDCVLFKSAKWIEGHSDLRSIQGDMTGLQQFSQIPSEGVCSMEYCIELSNNLPLYMGPWAEYRPDSYCLPHDARCLPVPVEWEEPPLSCCSVCGVMGSAPCDRCPLYERLDEGSLVVDVVSSFFMEWFTKWTSALDFPFEVREKQSNSWGCWSEEYSFENAVSIQRLFVDTKERCMDHCMTTESCVAWKWLAATRTPVLQKCELYSSVGSVKPNVNRSKDIAIAIGVEECLLPFERGVGWVLGFFRDELSADKDNEIEDDNSWMTFQELLDIRGTLNNLTERREKIIKIPIDPFEDWSRYTGFDNHDGVFEKEGEEYFVVDFTKASEKLRWAEGDKEERLGIGKYEPFGVQVQCGDVAPDVGCLVVCFKGADGEYLGAIKAIVSYLYDIYGQEVKGPGLPELLLLSGVCDSMVEGDSDSFWTTTTTTTTKASCIAYGHIGITDADPFELYPATDVELCIAACEDNDECTFFNYTDGACQMKQWKSEESMALLDFYKADAEICDGDCNSDSECHETSWLEPTCALYNSTIESLISTGKSNITATGPSDLCSFSWNTFGFVQRMAHMAPNYIRYVDIDGKNMVTVDDFITDVEVGENGCPMEYMNLNGKCLAFSNQRLLQRDAERACSDIGGHLLSHYTEDLVEELCDSGMVNCYASSRDSQYWVGMSPGKFFKHTINEERIVEQESEMNERGENKLEMIHVEDGHFNNCLIIDFATGELKSAPCGGFCITPATALTEWFNSPECTYNGNNGRLALKRLPYICALNGEAMITDDDMKDVEGFETVEAVTEMGGDMDRRRTSYIDDQGIERCGRLGSNIVDNDMFNTGEWSNPINSWRECEGLCRAFEGCEGFTYMPPTCSLMKEEADKGWPSTVATTVMAHHSGISGDDLCSIRCLNDKECNVEGVYAKGVCYLKTSNETITDEKSWLPAISGPVPCDAKFEANNAMSYPECPKGYNLHTSNGESICVAIHLARLTAPEAHRVCVQTGGILASPKTENENDALLDAFCAIDELFCVVPRGLGALDGVYYFGLGATKPMLNDTWHWVDGDTLDYEHKFGGGINPYLVYNGWPTVQPDNTSGNQLCSYFYPRDSPDGTRNGGWGDEDCDTKCLEPPSFNLQLSHAPLCNNGAGRVTTLGRRFVCTAEPIEV